MHRVRAYTFDFCSFLSVAYTTLNKLFAVFLYILYFLREGRFCRSRSSNVDEFGANRKRVCNFLLVLNSNLGPILHRFGDLSAFMCS